MTPVDDKKIRIYLATAVFSMLFALLGFSYNVWRMEQTEDNSNIRTACFEMLVELSAMEQLVFAAHYDQDSVAGNPRTGWVRVGLINDLSALASPAVQQKTSRLRQVWEDSWQQIATSRQHADQVVGSLDDVRAEIKQLLRSLD
ncbi:MAG: hypothetical protein PVG66_14855 [Chromatiales bacterium]|jgi:hypothetical protein